MTPQPESTWTRPRPDCPYPGRWHSTDPDSTEVEVTELVAGFVTALQPDLVVETGTAFGQTAAAIGRALVANGQGTLVTYEVDPARVAYSRDRVAGLPVDVQDVDSLTGIARLYDTLVPVGFAWLDSLFDLRVRELAALAPLLSPGAIVGVHDTGPQHPMRALLDAVDGRWVRIDLPTPRGVSFLQRR